MPGLLNDVDPDGLLEYSVVYTDRSLNHMSHAFQQVMRDISATLKSVYNASQVAVIPGSGTFGMEAVARQLATDKKTLIIRNGFFSYRWTQIIEQGGITQESKVLKAQKTGQGKQDPFVPHPIADVINEINSYQPDVVFAPHVETASGMILPDNYLKQVADAVHAYGGLFVLDCIASGTIWVDMEKSGVDVLISAPQKGWSGSPCCALVMMNETAHQAVMASQSTSFAIDLKKWLEIMHTYENGGHAYHTTMPTDSLRVFKDVMLETKRRGFDTVRDELIDLGARVREYLAKKGYPSVAAEGFQAPGVVVCYTDDPNIKNGSKFAELGLQIAAGVPLMVDEPEDYSSFRIGLFGLDKIAHIKRTIESLEEAVDKL